MKTLEQYPVKEWELNPQSILVKGKYISNWFSNMHSVVIKGVDDGILYLSVENYFQAHKTLDITTRLEVSVMNCYSAKKWAKTITPHKNWNDGLDVMYEALELKWKLPQWSSLLKQSQGDIVEWNNWRDYKWGVPISLPAVKGIYKGRNVLGNMLVEIRSNL